MEIPYLQTMLFRAALPLAMTLLLVLVPVGAQDSPVARVVAELSPKAGQPDFAGLGITKAREFSNLVDSLTLISELLTTSTNPADIRDLHVEMASMQELLGRYGEAAHSWEAAVAAQPGRGEPSWLLSAAACRLAIGDAGTATALAKAAMLTTGQPRLVSLAMLIEARALVLSGDMPGALARSLEALAVGSSGLEAAALSMAIDASAGVERESYAKRLREEYPGWPGTQDALVAIYSLSHSVPSQPPELRLPIPVTPAASVSPDKAASSPDRQAEFAQVVESKPLYYQLGAFRDEANAALLSTRLVRAGFTPKTVKREYRSGILSLVYLEAGPDPSRLMLTLKDAGFESWPLFTAP